MTKIGLALGAGGARGLALVHALRAFDDLGIKPDIVSGTSIGAIIGAAYCSGMSGEEVETYVLEKFRNGIIPLADALRLNTSDFAQFFKDGGPRIGELNLERLLRNFLPDQIPSTFEKLTISLKVIATDYYAERAIAFGSGELLPRLAASAAIPAIFLPVEIEGRFYVDGGTINPLPFDEIQEGVDVVVAVDVCGGTIGDPNKRPSKLDSVYAASQLMQKSIVDATMKTCQVDLLLRPPVGQFRVLDFLKTKSVIDETRSLREELKVKLSEILSNSDV